MFVLLFGNVRQSMTNTYRIESVVHSSFGLGAIAATLLCVSDLQYAHIDFLSLLCRPHLIRQCCYHSIISASTICLRFTLSPFKRPSSHSSISCLLLLGFIVQSPVGSYPWFLVIFLAAAHALLVLPVLLTLFDERCSRRPTMH
jgi:hypothetical protein